MNLKKVLITGPSFHNYHRSIEKAFQNLGYATRLIEYHKHIVNLGEKVRFVIDSKSYYQKEKLLHNQEVLKEYDEFKPDLIFMLHEGLMSRENLKKLSNAPKVMWMYDTINRFSRDYHVWDIMDKVYTYESSDIDIFKKQYSIDSQFLPLAFDEKEYFPIKSQKEIDLSFVGYLYDFRREIIDSIHSSIKNLNIKVYGKYYVPLYRPIHHLMRKDRMIYTNKEISHRDVNSLYNNSKVCLNVLHPQNLYGVNQRFFEIIGSGGIQLVNDNEYIRDNFKNSEVLCFKTISEAIQSVEEILKDNSIFDINRKNAYETAINNHTFTHRIKNILADMNMI